MTARRAGSTRWGFTAGGCAVVGHVVGEVLLNRRKNPVEDGSLGVFGFGALGLSIASCVLLVSPEGSFGFRVVGGPQLRRNVA
jgi:hypothetical protein